MRIAHTGTALDGKLYFPGSNEIQDTSSLSNIQVFNTEAQTWNDLLESKNRFSKFSNIEGKILMDKNWAVKLKDSTIDMIGVDPRIRDMASMCMIEKIAYIYHSIAGFQWCGQCGTEHQVRGKLKGLEGLPKFARYSKVTLAAYGAKMMVLWDKYVTAKGGYKEKMIWCAEISFEKRNYSDEIWGNVEWVDAVLKVPKSYKFVYAIAATV